MALTLTSPAFGHMEEIPSRHTCEGAQEAPPLSWSGVPEGTRSLALVSDDPDAPDPAAPQRVYVHWVVWDLPPDSTGLPAGGAVPAGARQGRNDSGSMGWRGPCPPIGRHRYFFKLYALDEVLGELREPTKHALEEAMKGRVLAHAELVGTYQLKKPR